MLGFHIYNAQVTGFDRYEFPVAAGKTEAVEGRHYSVIYYANDGITLPSALQIARNYEDAVKAIGGRKVYEFEDGAHTDNTGTFDHNLTLSRDRAQAVADLLVTRYGVDSDRLRPFGAGPTAPVASNSQEEGRAKNRRVEFVQQ